MEQRYNRKQPMVSIVTPSYNQAQFIEDTILSVKNQDYPNIEHIIIDGCSTDGTLDILKKYDRTYNMRWISEPDEGQSQAINKGFSMVQGDIVGWLNSDDIYVHTRVINDILDCFRNYPDIDVIYGDALLIDDHNRIMELMHYPKFSRRLILARNFISQPSVFMRKAIVENNKLDESLHFTMDYEYWLRLSALYSFKHVNLIVSGIRHYPERKTYSQRDLKQ